MQREQLFPDEPEPAVEADTGLMLVPRALPAVYPTKQEIRTYRAELIERLTGALGNLEAYLFVKFIEKTIADKDEGVVKMLGEHALKEFMQRFPNSKTETVRGAHVTVKGKSYYEYPADVQELEIEVEALKRKLAGAKKAAEIDGRAKKLVVPGTTISVSF